MMNETIKTLLERRSIRAYRPEQIKEEELQAILEAGLYAPSGMGRQAPVLVAIQDPQTIAQLSKMNAKIFGKEDIDPFYGAPTVVVALCHPKAFTGVEDCSLALGNMMNAAWSLGVDSCWIHRAKEEFASEEGKALLRSWGVPDDYVGVGHCLLGYRACEVPEAAPRKDGRLFRVI